MKTTVELPDELYHRAEAEAMLSGREFNDLIEEGLRLALDAPHQPGSQSSLIGLMKPFCGTVDSGVPDLGSNPAHLKEFGRDAGNR
jgi:hypothetical protein